MTPKQIGKAYDKLTHLWQSDFDMSNGISQHKKALFFVKNNAFVLDVGCGCTGRFERLLKDSGFAVDEVDISLKMIELAKKKFPEFNFYNEDICRWQPPKKYDFITAWDSIWHINLQDQTKVVEKLVKSLNVGGVLIFSFGGLEKKSEHRDDFMGEEVYYSTLGTNGFVQLLLDLNCTLRHLEYDQNPHAFIVAQKV